MCEAAYSAGVILQVLDEVTDVTLTKYLPRKPLVNGVKMNGLVH